MFNERPPQPKYTDTWDVEVVLEYLRQLPDNDQLELKELSLKLVMLLALVSAGRSSELHKCTISGMVDKGFMVELHVGALTKVRKVGEKPMVLKLQQYDPEVKLDVVRCLRTYLSKTEPVRQEGPGGDQILISFQKPHASLASSSVARWIKMGMQAAGIDIQKYQAHSTRSASTTKAAMRGLQTAQIMEQANWKRAMTFRRFYFKEVSCPFQDKVLS